MGRRGDIRRRGSRSHRRGSRRHPSIQAIIPATSVGGDAAQIIADKLGGAQKSYASVGPQGASLANAPAVGAQVNQETAARRLVAESRERRGITRDRRHIRHMGSQAKEPNLSKITRSADGQQRDPATRDSGERKQGKQSSQYKKNRPKKEITCGTEGGKGGSQRGSPDAGREYDNSRRNRARDGYGGGRTDTRGSKYRAIGDRTGSRKQGPKMVGSV